MATLAGARACQCVACMHACMHALQRAGVHPHDACRSALRGSRLAIHLVHARLPQPHRHRPSVCGAVRCGQPRARALLAFLEAGAFFVAKAVAAGRDVLAVGWAFFLVVVLVLDARHVLSPFPALAIPRGGNSGARTWPRTWTCVHCHRRRHASQRGIINVDHGISKLEDRGLWCRVQSTGRAAERGARVWGRLLKPSSRATRAGKEQAASQSIRRSRASEAHHL